MDTGQAIDLGRYAVVLTLTVAAPLLATTLIVALVVSTLQALTQIQEHTLSFVPKLVAVAVAALAAGPWIIAKIVEFARQVWALP